MLHTENLRKTPPDVGKRLSLGHSLGMDCKLETWHSPGLNSWTEAVRVQLQASKHSQQFSLSPQLAGNRNRRGVPHLEPRAGPLIPRMLPRRIEKLQGMSVIQDNLFSLMESKIWWLLANEILWRPGNCYPGCGRHSQFVTLHRDFQLRCHKPLVWPDARTCPN